MRGYSGRHFGRGYGQGYGAGYGRGWCHDLPGAVRPPEGFTYLGPCRCGSGPHAYWQDKKTGRIFHGSPHYGTWFGPGYGWPGREPSEEELKSELDWLKQQKEELEKRIQEMEEALKQKDSKTQAE